MSTNDHEPSTGTEPVDDARAAPADTHDEASCASAELAPGAPTPPPACEEPPAPSAVEPARTRGEPFRLRKLVSLSLLLLLLATAVSGMALHLAPAHGAGRGVAEIAGWPVAAWASFHAALTVALVVACLAHLAFNARTIWCYVRGPRAGRAAGWRMPISRELLVALPLAILVVAAAAWTMPSGHHGPAGRGPGHAWRDDPGAGRAIRAKRERGPRRAAATAAAERRGRSSRDSGADGPRP
jgi:hypothetical protein